MNNANNDIYHQQLRAGFAQWAELTDTQWNRLASIFQLSTVPKQAYIALPGDPVHKLYFICHGLLRFFYLDKGGTETNKAFKSSNQFARSAAVTENPSIYGVQALEPTTLFMTPYTDFVNLFEEDPAFERLGRQFSEWLLCRVELRARSLLQKNATERYLDFLNEHQHLTHRIPQYHIASYLGITEVSLSRLRRDIELPATP